MRAERLGESWADWRCNVSAQEEQQFPYLLDRVPVEGDPLPDEFLRFGMFADGGKATNLDRPSYDHDHEPDRPVLHQQAGGGGGSAWDVEHWMWPLPPNGRLASCASGPVGASRSRGPSSTPRRSWKRPAGP